MSILLAGTWCPVADASSASSLDVVAGSGRRDRNFLAGMNVDTPTDEATAAWTKEPWTNAPCWQPPVAAPVADPFRNPDCPWCAGNRGIEYATTPGTLVRAVAPGTVTFAGTVAGTGYVVVEHADGVRATYGGLDQIGLSVGDVVIARMGVGFAGQRMHFGLRQGDEYVDPTPFLGTQMWRIRLVPIDGSPPRPVPEPTWSCR